MFLAVIWAQRARTLRAEYPRDTIISSNPNTNQIGKIALKTTEQMNEVERVDTYGYDPLAGLVFIGVSEPVTHRGREVKFGFYYNAETGKIDVCFAGCNGTYISGIEISDAETTLPTELGEAFFEVKSRVPDGYTFRNKEWLGRVVAKNYRDGTIFEGGWPIPSGKKIDVHFDMYYDPETRSLDVHYVGVCSPFIRTTLSPDGTSTLPPEIHVALENLLRNPQSSVKDHNVSCKECSEHLLQRNSQ